MRAPSMSNRKRSGTSPRFVMVSSTRRRSAGRVYSMKKPPPPAPMIFPPIAPADRAAS